MGVYLVCRGDTAIMVTASNAGAAYEKARSLGFPYTRTQGTGVKRLYTLDTIKVKGHDVMTQTTTQPGS